MAFNAYQPSIVRLCGRLDAASSQDLRDRLEAAIAPTHPTIGQQPPWAIDLSGVDFIDGVGLATLVALYRRAQEHHLSLMFINPQPPVRLVFEIAQIDRVFDIYPSYEAAIAAWESARAAVIQRPRTTTTAA
ncbi:MAG: STAS domain-containing protein [Cyanobacteria bacterium]|nr:STAS domain-containing protein [Cyanobacteriota bacterium]